MANQIELRTIRIRLTVCSLAKAREIGLDWWMYDRHLAPGRAGAAERDRLEQRIAALPASAQGPRATLPPRGVDNAR